MLMRFSLSSLIPRSTTSAANIATVVVDPPRVIDPPQVTRTTPLTGMTAAQLATPKNSQEVEDQINFLCKSDVETRADTNRQFYEDFWDSSREERTEFFKDLISVNGASIGFLLRNKTFIESTLLPKFLPMNTQARQDAEKKRPGTSAYENGMNFANYIATVLGKGGHIDMLANVLSAMVTAIHDHPIDTNQSNEMNEIIFGKRLSTFLLEAGAIKLAQNIHSFDNTPSAWKVPLENSKSEADPMGYEAFVKQARKTLPPELFTNIEIPIDGHRGAGTYLDTYAIKFKAEYLQQHPEYKENNFVLQLVKPGAGLRSQASLNLVIDAMEALMSKKQDAKESLSGIVDVFKETQHLMQEETDLTLVPEKAKMAEKLYEGLRVELPNIEIEFHTPGFFDYNKNFRICRDLKGQHFNDIFKNDPAKLSLKKEIALAILISELYMMLTGKPFDHDRHGANQNIEVLKHPTKPGKLLVRIGNFDEHGIILTPPTTAQKEIFANVLLDALANSAINGFNPVSSLKHTFGRAQAAAQSSKQTINDTNYVNHMINAVLKHGDYRAVLAQYSKDGKLHESKTQLYKNLLKALKVVINTGHVDPVISKVFAERLKKIRLQLVPGASKYAANRLGLTDELRRRAEFYPRPNAKEAQYTSRLKQLMGVMALMAAPAALQYTRTNQRTLTFPLGYKSRF